MECKERGEQRNNSWAGTVANNKAGGGQEVNPRRRRGNRVAAKAGEVEGGKIEPRMQKKAATWQAGRRTATEADGSREESTKRRGNG